MNAYRRYLRSKVRHQAIVHLKSGTSIKGVLHEVYRDVLVMRNAEAAPSGASTLTAVDGEQLVSRSDVDWIQILPEQP